MTGQKDKREHLANSYRNWANASPVDGVDVPKPRTGLSQEELDILVATVRNRPEHVAKVQIGNLTLEERVQLEACLSPEERTHVSY